MPAIDVPLLGNLVLCLVLLSAAWTFALALGATRGRPHLLVAARFGAYATCGFVALAVCMLAFAFQTHDYRLTYVARYSDRSMPWSYLVTSLWGGQDGSILWWTLLLSIYTALATRSLRGRLLELQPWILATLMSIFAFFVLLMLFPANPFATYVGTAPADGEGLNPLLQNYWMTIHPPSLYLGFVGWSVPFAFAMAALATGRLDDEWLKAARPWAMIAWCFLSLGLLLGCRWSYEELGWGGYWAWDPVENASFMPWLVGTAYVHSAIVQERYAMLKMWNISLICGTFFMTIFGTFLTRSGLIASVHAFARSDIGIYFVWYMALLAAVIIFAIAYRSKELRSRHSIDSLMSREFAFLFNNWILLAMMVVVLGFTMWPWVSSTFIGEEQSMGPAFYNQFMPFLGLVLLFLAGVGPLITWRKATASKLGRALAFPGLSSIAVALLQVAFGSRIGFPAYVEHPPLNDTPVMIFLGKLAGLLPVMAIFTITFVLLTVGQEFARGTQVRMRVKNEGVFVAFTTLVWRARRRFGGYIVHAGVALIFFGFTGSAYDQDREAAVRPGRSFQLGEYRLRYEGPRMEVDPDKRMIFADLSVSQNGVSMGRVSPAKYVYRLKPDMPTTEVAIEEGRIEDLYMIMSTVDPTTRRATFKVLVRPFVVFIWLGGLIGLLGAILAAFPDVAWFMGESASSRSASKPSRRAVVAIATLVLAALLLAPALVLAQDDSSSLHAGDVPLLSHAERTLFPRLLCQCGSCPRLPLDACICGWAESKRAELRGRLSAGEALASIQASYAATYGRGALSVPEDRGAGRALWAVPLTLTLAAAGGLVVLARSWRASSLATSAAEAVASDYDKRLDDELARLDEEDS